MKVNKSLLKQLYLIKHPSGTENEMMSFIINYCYNIPNLTFYFDHYSNLFITKNTTNPEVYPCLIAHTDEALTYKYDKEIVEKHPYICGRYVDTKKQCGLGADDANGIYVMLELLNILPNLKCVFTVEEELGCVGAEQAVYNIGFFENCQYFIQADRRGKSDVITYSNGIDITSKEFMADIADVMVAHRYREQNGIYTDIGVFVRDLNISGINVSCGYYGEHTMYERTNVVDLENCLNFIYSIIIELGDKIYPHVSEMGWSETYRYHPDYDDGRAYSECWDEWEEAERRKYKDDRHRNSDISPCDRCITYDCMHCNVPYY